VRLRRRAPAERLLLAGLLDRPLVSPRHLKMQRAATPHAALAYGSERKVLIYPNEMPSNPREK